MRDEGIQFFISSAHHDDVYFTSKCLTDNFVFYDVRRCHIVGLFLVVVV
jgi:hypothetical protein